MPFVCLTCGAELSERDENSEDFGCAFCGGFLTESQTQQQDFLDSAELRDGTKAGGADFSTRRRFQRGEFRQHVDDLEPCEERHLNWELYVKYNYGLKNQQEIFQQMLVAAAICFNCDPTMVLEHGKQLWFQFLESIQVDETPGQVHNEDAMALQFSHLNGLVQHITDRIVGYYNPGPFEHCFKRREKCAWVKLALQKHEQLLQGRLKQLQKATGHHSILTAPGFGRLSSVQRAEILRQEVRKRTQARLRLDKPILIDSHGQVVPHDGLEEKEKQEFYQRLLHEHAVVADAEASLSGDSSDEEQRVAESKEAEEAEEAQRPAAREKKKAKAIAEQVILASDSEEATAKNMASHPKKKVAAPLKNQNPKQVEDDPGANYHDAEDVTERRRLFLAMIWMALSSSGQAVLLGDVILAAFQGPLKPWIEKYEHLEFLKRSIRLPPLNQDTLYEQLKARCGRLIRCRYRFLSQHPEMFLHRFAGLLEDERSVMEWARMCCRSRHLAGYWQRMIMSIEQFYGLCAKVKGVSDKYKEGSEWCPASKAFFCVLAGMRLKKMQADEEAKVQDMLDKQSWEKAQKEAQKEGEKDQEEGKDKVEVPEGGRLWTAKGLKSIPALYEKKAVKKAKSKPQYTDRVQLRTTTNLKNRQRERSRSRGAGRDDAKDIGKKGQKEQNDERQGKEDEQTRHMKYMARLARLALEMTETLMGKKCRDTAVQFTLHADLLATEIYRGTGRKRPQILRGPLVAALDAAN